MTPSSTDDYAEAVRYFWIAIQYYLLGRQALLRFQVPVCGNLLHHAFEMLMKAALHAHHIPRIQLERFRHRFGVLWSAYKASVGDSEILSRFDETIRQLDEWEEIRYPSDKKRAAQMRIHHGDMPDFADPKDAYNLNLEDVDELAKMIVERFHEGVSWLRSDLKDSTLREWYFEENRHPAFDRSVFVEVDRSRAERERIFRRDRQRVTSTESQTEPAE